MKYFILNILLLILSLMQIKANNLPDDPNILIEEMIADLIQVRADFDDEITKKEFQLRTVKSKLGNAFTTEQKMNLLLEKDALEDELADLGDAEQMEMTKIRYLKGLQIIRLLYDKVLSLDHHFASVATFNEINNISNPNHYPEFEKAKEIISGKKNNKLSLDLTSMLGANAFASVTQMFLNLFGSDLSSNEKKAELEQIECILDFTLRMHQDLNTIYYETSYLQASNAEIKKSIEQLFRDYTKPLGYFTELSECRANDDWDEVNAKLEAKIKELESLEGREQYKAYANIEFPIDRLLQFINQYNEFINEGVKFYQKFNVILNSYENEEQCESKLPTEYTKLKNDITVAIDKFNVAYRPVEINGSKMKQVLYGLNEYD